MLGVRASRGLLAPVPRRPPVAAADRGPAMGLGTTAPRRAAPGSRKGRGGLSEGHWRPFGRPVHCSREGSARLSREHCTALDRAVPDSGKSTGQLRRGQARTPRRGPGSSRGSCGHLDGEHGRRPARTAAPRPKSSGLLSRGRSSAPERARLPGRESSGQLSRGLWTALGLEKAATPIGSFGTWGAAFMTAAGASPTWIGAPPT